MINKRLIFGFTLAEVLITLGIIGVVAAMTIPNLISSYKKHVTATRLERSMSVITQAIRLSENENGQMENWDKSLDYEEFINTYFRPFMNIMQVCSSDSRCGYDSSTNKIWKLLNGNYGAYNSPFNQDRHGLLTSDGFIYFYGINPIELSTDNDKIIIVDINGSSNPNQQGKDVFFFIRDEDSDSIIPYGADKTSAEIKSSCSETGNGLYCAAWIRENGWHIPSGYPKL